MTARAAPTNASIAPYAMISAAAASTPIAIASAICLNDVSTGLPDHVVLAFIQREIVQKMDVRPKWISLAVGLDDAMLKQIELPPIPVDDMRLVLKNNPKVYLQQDLPNYTFDCHIFRWEPGLQKLSRQKCLWFRN